MLSTLSTLTHKQQASLFHEVAKVYLEQDVLSDESLGRRVRSTLIPLLKTDEEDPTPFVIGQSIFYGRSELDLSTKPQMLRLFSFFLQKPHRFIQRDEVLEQLYGVEIKDLSPRLLCSLRNNLVKLVSRARANANEAFATSGPIQEWFVHDYKSRSWCLLRTSSMERHIIG